MVLIWFGFVWMFNCGCVDLGLIVLDWCFEVLFWIVDVVSICFYCLIVLLDLVCFDLCVFDSVQFVVRCCWFVFNCICFCTCSLFDCFDLLMVRFCLFGCVAVFVRCFICFLLFDLDLLFALLRWLMFCCFDVFCYVVCLLGVLDLFDLSRCFKCVRVFLWLLLDCFGLLFSIS